MEIWAVKTYPLICFPAVYKQQGKQWDIGMEPIDYTDHRESLDNKIINGQLHGRNLNVSG